MRQAISSTASSLALRITHTLEDTSFYHLDIKVSIKSASFNVSPKKLVFAMPSHSPLVGSYTSSCLSLLPATVLGGSNFSSPVNVTNQIGHRVEDASPS